MKTIALALGLAAAAGLACTAAANATPADPAALRAAATADSPAQQAQYAEYRTRHGMMKCYREFVIGPYRCHYIRYPLLPF